MVRKFKNISLIDRLRQGEKINCLKCGKGIYVTTEGYVKTSHCFWCDKCGDMVECVPSEIIVE